LDNIDIALSLLILLEKRKFMSHNSLYVNLSCAF